jgi:deoxyadenosine/deoxycytidine kinase
MNSEISISLEANIGAGKTTFLTALRRDYPQFFNDIPEPLEDWLHVPQGAAKNALGLLYEDPKRYGYMFQHNAFFTRVHKIKKCYDPTRINITERSVISDFQVFANILHDEGNLNANEWDIYKKWKVFLMESIPVITPTFHVYLKLDPEVAYKRIQQRNRKEETGIPYEYIAKVHAYHEKWLTDSEIPVLELDATLDFENDQKIFDTYVDKILSFCWRYIPKPNKN